MRIDVFSIFPEYLAGPLGASLLGRAAADGVIDVRVHDIRGWATDRHRTVDDAPFGGGAGMVMTPGPLFDAVESVEPSRPSICSPPQGDRSTRRWRSHSPAGRDSR